MSFVHILEGRALGFATVSLYCITAVHNGCMKGQNLQNVCWIASACNCFSLGSE